MIGLAAPVKFCFAEDLGLTMAGAVLAGTMARLRDSDSVCGPKARPEARTR